MKACVFFDRDGIVNLSPGPGYVERWNDFHLVPSFVDALRVATERNHAAVIVTNQRGVALGFMTEETLVDMHEKLRGILRHEHGLDVLDVLYCPHHKDTCECRKPKPGMLLEGARRHDIDLGLSWMIGDSERDIEAGHAAGCRAILVSDGHSPTTAEHRLHDMSALPALLERVLPATG
jgi:D-glycero-D-manno-heptose 1,7-bisphosphate phosphatase